MRERWKQFPSNQALKETDEIWKVVEACPDFISADTVLIYMDLPGEVPTAEFIKKWCGIKRFAIPKVCSDTGMILKEYSEGHLSKGAFGITEPTDGAAAVNPSEIEFAIVPGVAFGLDGSRLGRGKAYYDRLLPQLNCPVAGLCFSFRLCGEIPVDTHDIPMNHIFSGKTDCDYLEDMV